MLEAYKHKVSLLITVLPYISDESDLALHGGTAINLFVKDMPRLSVDIDLLFLPIKGREDSLEDINTILARIKSKIELGVKGSVVHHDKARWKLIILREEVDIKLEVNVVNRGALSDPQKMTLCNKAQEEFEAYVTMPVVPFDQLYGGKVCAALDRQHPRDIFDIQYLLEEKDIIDKIRRGFIFSLASSNRPIHELLKPNLFDHKETMENQFYGMSSEEFLYEQFEKTREILINTVHDGLNSGDKEFLLSIKKLQPNWYIYDFERFPSIQWKLQNLKSLKEKNNRKYLEMVEALEKALGV